MFEWNEYETIDTIKNYKYGNDYIKCILCTIPSKDWRLTFNKFKDDELCIFCLDNNSNNCALLRCNHQFHINCMIKWSIEKKLNIPYPLKYICSKKIYIFKIPKIPKIPDSWEDLIPKKCDECGKIHMIS
jgi:hypothetical protein